MFKSFRFISTTVIAIVLLLQACSSQAPDSQSGELQGNISISGAFALYPMMTRWAEEYQKIYPGVQFDISAGGAGKGMADTLSNAVDIGMVSRDVTPEEEAQGAYWVAVTKDAVFPVINAENPVLQDLMVTGVTNDTFIKIFITGETKTWGEVVGKPEISAEIHVYTRSDSCGAAETWAKFLGGTQENLLGIGVFGDPGLLDAVIKDPDGIGYNNLNYAFDIASSKPVAGAIVLPIDDNENGQADPEEILETNKEAVEMVATGNYPSPPARPLYLVTNGKPSALVQNFIEWILTDGQQFIGEAGYVQLTKEQLQEARQKIR